jgi:segregation and condensation protein A
MLDINVKLDSFEGPIGLLYHLIEKNEIDIYDIPIADVADQYMAVVSTFGADMESLSEFIVMAATLLEIKSKMLLPAEKAALSQDEPDPREELVARLLEYKRFKDISEVLMDKEHTRPGIMFKQAETALLNMIKATPVTDISELLSGVTMDALMNVFLETVNRKELKIDRVRASYGLIKRDEYTVENRMEHIRNIMRFRPEFSLNDVFSDAGDKGEVIASFVALLELIRLKEARIRQDGIFGDILISRVR